MYGSCDRILMRSQVLFKKFIFILFIVMLYPFQSNFAEKLYIVKYGESIYPGHLTNRLGSTSVKFGWNFYYFEKEPYRILIDAGIVDLNQVQKFKIKNYNSPEILLLKKGITPDQITDIFITHSHFDHIEGVLKFPNAKIHIQSLEYNQFKKSTYYKINENSFLKKEKDRLVLQYNGESTIYEMVKLIPTGGHTIGSQAIEIQTEKSHFLFTGDECYFVEECKKGIGTFSKALYSPRENSIFMKKIIEYRLNPTLKILTMHDPALEKELEIIE